MGHFFLRSFSVWAPAPRDPVDDLLAHPVPPGQDLLDLARTRTTEEELDRKRRREEEKRMKKRREGALSREKRPTKNTASISRSSYPPASACAPPSRGSFPRCALPHATPPPRKKREREGLRTHTVGLCFSFKTLPPFFELCSVLVFLLGNYSGFKAHSLHSCPPTPPPTPCLALLPVCSPTALLTPFHYFAHPYTHIQAPKGVRNPNYNASQHERSTGAKFRMPPAADM